MDDSVRKKYSPDDCADVDDLVNKLMSVLDCSEAEEYKKMTALMFTVANHLRNRRDILKVSESLSDIWDYLESIDSNK